MQNITIFTDTTCDLDLDYLESIGVKYLPLTIEIGNSTYKDRIEITSSEFYEKISAKDVYPKTSLVSPQDFEDNFRRELESGNDVICITISSGLSGTYNSAILAKNNIESDKLHVIDSKAGSVGVGMVVIEAARLSKICSTSAEIVEKLNDLISKQTSFIYVESMEMLKRNGRIPSALAAIGGLLRIKPILTLKDGNLEVLTKARGQKIAFNYMVDEISKESLNLDYPFMIGHADNKEYAEIIKNKLLEHYPEAKFIICEIGPTIGSHSGKDALALWSVKL